MVSEQKGTEQRLDYKLLLRGCCAHQTAEMSCRVVRCIGKLGNQELLGPITHYFLNGKDSARAQEY